MDISIPFLYIVSVVYGILHGMHFRSQCKTQNSMCNCEEDGANITPPNAGTTGSINIENANTPLILSTK